MYEYDETYERARKIVREREQFKKRLISFIGVSLFLVAINIFTTPEYLWAVWPMMGMGLGVFMKGMKLYGPLKSNPYNQEDKIRREIKKMEYRKNINDRQLPPAKDSGLTLKSLKKREELKADWNEKDFV